MIKINLIGGPTARKKSFLSQGIQLEYLLGALLFLVVVGMAFWYWHLSSQYAGAVEQKANLQQQSLALVAVRAELEKYEQQRNELEERADVIERLRATQKGPVLMMNAIIESIPAEPRLWLTRLGQEADNVTIEGRAFDVPAIADFVSSLGRRPPFQSVELDYWEETEDTVNFELSCKIGNE